LILNKFQTDYFPSIHFKNWKEKKKVYLPMTVQVKSQSLEKKYTQNEMARAALLQVQEDMKAQSTENVGTGAGSGVGVGLVADSSADIIPQVEEDLFLLSEAEFDDVYTQVVLNKSGKSSSESSFDPRICYHVRQYTSRYAQAGYKHWLAQFSGTYHEREGMFYDIKFANDMYKVIDFGKISGVQSFSSFEQDSGPQRSTYLYPLGYKCLRTLVLCFIPREDIDRSRFKPNSSKFKAIQSPENYSHLEVEFMSEVVSQSVNNNSVDPSPYALRISVGNSVTVVEVPLTKPDSCKAAWGLCLKASLGPPILKALGAPLRRCRAVLNRLCTLPFIMPFIECIPVTNHKASVAYYSVTPAPMWLREVHSRLNEGTYEYVYDFAWDVRLVFTNCFDYNLPSSAIHKDAVKALNFFELLMCQWVYNVRDLSITDLATGPWDLWMHLKYFDGHTNIASSLFREVDMIIDSVEPSKSPAMRRVKEHALPAQEVNRCCVTNSTGSLKHPLLFCELCEDSYHPDTPEAEEGEKRAKIWVCRRCVAAPDWEECIKNPDILLTSQIETETTGDAKMDVDLALPSDSAATRYVMTDQYLPAPEFGMGWCATKAGANQKFLSPFGYHLSNGLEMYRHMMDEVETHNEQLSARESEFRIERERLVMNNSSKSKKPKAALKKKRSIKKEDKDAVDIVVPDTMLTTGKAAVCCDADDQVCVWMGFIEEVESPLQAYLPSAAVQQQQARLAIKQSKVVTSTNISSMFSAWGRDPEKKTHLSVLNLEETDDGSSSHGTSDKMLTTAGLTGLDDPVIHLCVEGLEGLELMLTCFNVTTPMSTARKTYAFEYMYAPALLSELKEHLEKASVRRNMMAKVKNHLISDQ
jgi:hypothetical protein